MTEALEWLIEHQDDSDDDSDDETDFLPADTMTDTDIANPGSSMNTKKKSFKEACLELFKGNSYTKLKLCYYFEVIIQIESNETYEKKG